MNTNGTCVVQVTAEVEQFVVSMSRATAAVKAFNAALRSIPWYMRLWFCITSFLAKPLFPRPKAEHVPMTHRADGSKIGGARACANCMLSETYWQRWPDCDTDNGYCLHGDHCGPHVRQWTCIDWLPSGHPRVLGYCKHDPNGAHNSMHAERADCDSWQQVKGPF